MVQPIHERIAKILKELIFWISIFNIGYILISLPLIITLWLFPLDHIPLATGQDKEISVIERIGVEKPTFRSLLADILQIPLKLDWHDIHFEYDLRIPKGLTLKTLPAITVNFIKGGPNKYDSSIIPLAENDARNLSIPPWKAAYSIAANSPLIFPYLDNDSMIWQTFASFEANYNSKEPYIPFFTKQMYRAYATPHPIAWLVKFILIFIAFYGILNFFIKLIIKSFKSMKYLYRKSLISTK